MRIRQEQFHQHLSKSLASVYVIFGDEPFLVSEMCDMVRKRAKAAGFIDRITLNADPGFEWSTVLEASSNLSLFSEKQIIDLRIINGKPGDAGSKVLQRYLDNICSDNILLISSLKFDKTSQKTKWFSALGKAAVVVQAWPPDARSFPSWISRRMQEKGMRPHRDVVDILAQRGEGNLLACSQEIDKLFVLHGNNEISVSDVIDNVANSSRYSVFSLVDATIGGDVRRAVRILDGLFSEGAENLLILWALAKEIRGLVQMSHACQAGESLDQVMARNRVWDKRKAIIRKALQRHKVESWQHLLLSASRIDHIIKGVQQGNAAEELLQLVLRVAGEKSASHG